MIPTGLDLLDELLTPSARIAVGLDYAASEENWGLCFLVLPAALDDAQISLLLPGLSPKFIQVRRAALRATRMGAPAVASRAQRCGSDAAGTVARAGGGAGIGDNHAEPEEGAPPEDERVQEGAPTEDGVGAPSSGGRQEPGYHLWGARAEAERITRESWILVPRSVAGAD